MDNARFLNFQALAESLEFFESLGSFALSYVRFFSKNLKFLNSRWFCLQLVQGAGSAASCHLMDKSIFRSV